MRARWSGAVMIGLGGLLFTSGACQDKRARDALAACQAGVGELRSQLATQAAVVADLKVQLAKAQSAATEPAKTVSDAKAGQKPVAPASKVVEARRDPGAAKEEIQPKSPEPK